MEAKVRRLEGNLQPGCDCPRFLFVADSFPFDLDLHNNDNHEKKQKKNAASASRSELKAAHRREAEATAAAEEAENLADTGKWEEIRREEEREEATFFLIRLTCIYLFLSFSNRSH